MGDQDILEHIDGLIAEERSLRARSTRGDMGLSAEERVRLRELEVRLDQCWDLLRQRRARDEFGEDPDATHERPPGEVESYLQ